MATGPLQGFVNAFVRTAYRIAYYLLRIWWFLRRPETHAAAVALWHEGRVLLIRTSYRGCYSLPGGFLRSGEPSEQAARRELKEELGITLPPQPLYHAWHGMIPFESRQDVLDIRETRVDAAPTSRVSGREIVWAGWVTPAEAAQRLLLPHVAAYLEQAAERMPPASV